jgi:hypothetical protein
MVHPSGVERLAALAVLGLTERATPEQITSAYRRLAKATHPDATGSTDPEGSDRFADVSDAYRRLTQERPSEVHPPVVVPPPATSTTPTPTWFGRPAQRPPIVAGPVTVSPNRPTDAERGGSA